MEELKLAGLTENESKVYLALIDLGPSLAGRISRKTGLHRRSVYDTTETLIQKGLISYILENNRRVFRANNPENIISLLDEKKVKLEPVVKFLKEKYSKNRERDQTFVFKGRNGLKSVFESQLEHKEILIIGATPKAYDIIPYYFGWFNKRRKKKRIKMKIITHDRNIKPKGFVENRYLPEKYNNPVTINIYGDNVAILVWSAQPIAIVIKSRDVAMGYRMYFYLMWNIAKK